MSEVFISYAHSTDPAAERVAAALRELGYSVWRDEQLPAHRAYSEVIEERLDQASAVVVLWSDPAVRSEWVRSEANRAREARKLVQATLDGAALPMPFDQIQCADLRSWTGDLDHPAWRKVAASVGELVGRGGVRGAAASTAGPAPTPARKVGGRRRAGWIAGLAASALAVAAVIVGLLTIGHPAVTAGNPAFGKPVRADVMAFEARRPDPELQRLAVAASQAVVRRLVSGGMTARQQALDPGGSGGGAEFRVVGWVDRRGGDILMDTQLVDRQSGQILWSGHDEKPVALADDMVDNAGEAIAFVMQCALADRRISRTAWSTDVTGLYLNTCDALDAPDRMIAAARRLVAAAPRMAGAHAMLSIALAQSSEREGASPGESAAARAAAAREAEAALALDPRWPKAFLGREIARGVGHWFEREADLQAAMSIDPDLPPPQFRYAALLSEVGRTREAIAMSERTASLGDPRSGAGGYVRLAVQKAATGDPAGADQALETVGEASAIARSARWLIAVFWRPPAEGLEAISRPGDGPRDPRMRTCFEKYLRALVAQEKSGAPLKGLPAECERVESQWRLRMLAREGDVDGAFAMLATKPVSRFDTVQLFYIDMKKLRADSRFIPMAARLGLVDYWRRSGHWPDFCSAPDRPYDCQAAAKGL